MAINWWVGFFQPLISLVFLGGIILFIVYIVGKAIYNAYTKSFKFFLKYSIFRRQYPETIVKWCMECVEKGIGYYDAKKLLFVGMVDQGKINETMYIFDKILNQLGKEAGVKPQKGHEKKEVVELPLW
jgi:hypothetical protein